ncbi:hypothetical protein [Aeoliella sp.]|uniref:hypothetical protein n=1 Tax=Aeoliella sp. TaxID=2795800 RepID=UPI003CCC0512
MYHRVRWGIVLALLACPAFPTHAGLSGGGWYEWSASSTSENGEYVFVSLHPNPIDEQVARIRSCGNDPPYLIVEDEVDEVQRLYDTYPCSGMYRNDGSTTPLWTTGGRIYGGIPSPNGRMLFSSSFNYFFSISVCDGPTPKRTLTDLDMIGYVPFALNTIANSPGRYMEDYQLDANWQHAKVIWDNGSTTTVRLDDFAIVQSNTLGYSLYHLFTTVRGLLFVLVVCFVTSMLGYLLTILVMRVRKVDDRR